MKDKKYVGCRLSTPLEGMRFGVFKVQFSGDDKLIALVIDARRTDRIVDMLNGVVERGGDDDVKEL